MALYKCGDVIVEGLEGRELKSLGGKPCILLKSGTENKDGNANTNEPYSDGLDLFGLGIISTDLPAWLDPIITSIRDFFNSDLGKKLKYILLALVVLFIIFLFLKNKK